MEVSSFAAELRSMVPLGLTVQKLPPVQSVCEGERLQEVGNKLSWIWGSVPLRGFLSCITTLRYLRLWGFATQCLRSFISSGLIHHLSHLAPVPVTRHTVSGDAQRNSGHEWHLGLGSAIFQGLNKYKSRVLYNMLSVDSVGCHSLYCFGATCLIWPFWPAFALTMLVLHHLSSSLEGKAF